MTWADVVLLFCVVVIAETVVNYLTAHWIPAKSVIQLEVHIPPTGGEYIDVEELAREIQLAVFAAMSSNRSNPFSGLGAKQ